MPKGRPRVINQRPVLSPDTERSVKQDLQRMAHMAGIQVEEVDPSVPGTKLDKYLATARKVPFTMKWFKEHHKMVTITPEENLSVTINGVRVDFLTDRTVEVPEPFVGEYMRYRKSVRNAGLIGFRAGNTIPEGVVGVIPGAGGLTPEVTENG